jgi:RNA polymerase sigma-70 factor (ECF subfamily)
MFERRGVTATTKAPALPRRARRHLAELCFVETIQHSAKRIEDADSARLVAEFQLGDQSAFSKLYERYFNDVYGYLRMLLCDYHEAEDATQQAFTKAFLALPGFQLRAGTPFRAWLFRIARNEALGHLRKSKRVDVEDPETIDGRRNGPELALPHDALGWLSDSQLIGLIERLPAAQRQTLALRYIVGMQTSEMAEVLGKSAQAIRKLEHRALRHLEERLTPGRQATPSRLQRVGMLARLRRAPVLGARRFSLTLSQHPASLMRARRSW